MFIAFLKLIHYRTLSLIAIAQLGVYFFILKPYNATLSLGGIQFLILVTATLSLAAAASIINKIYDNQNDGINISNLVIIDFEISEKKAFNAYIIFTVIGILLGFYIANSVGKSSFSAFFVGISITSYLNASYFKTIPVVGNVLVAAMLALVFISIGLFVIIPNVIPENQQNQQLFYSIITDYAILAFCLGLLLEIVKDVIQMDADYKIGMKTIPILLGKQRSLQLIGLLTTIVIGALVWYTYNYLFTNTTAVFLVLLGLIAPLLFFAIKCWTLTANTNYLILKRTLQLVLIAAICSIFCFKFIIPA